MILCIGDVHLSDKPPASCMPEYNEQILTILADIAEHLDYWKVDTVVFAGDIFHSKIPSRTSHTTMTKLMEILAGMGEYGTADPRTILIVPGNHDMQHDRIQSLPNQPLGTIFASGLAEELTADSHAHLNVHGIPWQPDWSNYGIEAGFGTAFESEHLTVMHAPIMPIQESAPFGHIPREELMTAMLTMKLRNASIYYGHIHDDHGSVTDAPSGNSITNFGAISRGSLHELDLQRTLAVGLWDEKHPELGIVRQDIHTEDISLVLRAEAIIDHTRKADAQIFLETLTATTLTRLTPQAVAAAAEAMGCEPEVIELVKELMQA